MGWQVELVYPTVGGLRTEIETQLGIGGLYLETEVPAGVEGEVVLRLVAPKTSIEVAARIVDPDEGSFCLEVDTDVAAGLKRRVAAWEASAAEIPSVSFLEVEADASEPEPAGPSVENLTLAQKISVMSIGEKLQLAQHGQRDARAILGRDRAGTIQAALIRNPRISVEELTAMARGPTLAPDAAEAMAQHPTFGSSAQIVLALVRNPRTPLPIATQLVQRLLPADLRTIAKGLGVRMQVASAARKRLNE